MITKEQLSASMLHECDVILHLASKLGPSAMDYRPSPAQRSTLELLRYLSICGSAGVRCLAESNWKLFGDYAARAKVMTPAEFPEAMARQKQELAAFFAAVSETTLETQSAAMPGGGTRTLGLAILDAPFKWLTAYKLQLFLYAKACGASTIGTANAWAGVDRIG